MQINNINKVNDNFGCFTTLYAEDLNRFGRGINDIIDALDEISNYINNHEESWSESGGGGTPSNLNYPLSSINRMGSGVSPGQMIYFNGNSWIYKDYKELPSPLSELYTTTFPSNLNGIYSLVYDQSSENKGWKLLDYQNAPGSGLNTNSIADKLNNITNPGSGSSRKVLVWNYNNDNTWTLQDYSSQTSPTTGLTWDDLSTVILSTTELLIDISHLQRALTQALSNYVTKGNLASNKYKWWGQSLSGNDNDGYTVTGSLKGGIDHIEFANGVCIGVYPTGGTSGSTIQVYRNDGNLAHIFATGGVSALGNSSSGGGGGQGSSLPDGQSPGQILVWDGDSWEPQNNNSGLNNVLSELNVNSLPGNAGTSYVVTKNSDDPAYEFLKFLVVGTSENNQLVLTNIILGDDNYSIPVSQGVVYSTLTSGNHSSDSSYVIKGSGYSGSQLNATKFLKEDGSWDTPENTTYSKATSSDLGLIKLGDGDLIDSSSNNIYPIQLDSYDKAYVYVPWTDTDTQYSAGDGLTGTSEFSVLRNGGDNSGLNVSSSGVKVLLKNSNSGLELNRGLGVKATGGLTVDNDGVKIDPTTNKRVLWGNQDTLTNDIGKSGENNTRSLDYVLNVSMYGGVVMHSKNSQIQMADPAGTTRNVLNLTDKNQKDVYYGNTFKAFLDVGYGCARVTTGDDKSALRLWGNDILFKANGSDENNGNTMILTKEGSAYLPLATTGPKEGNTYKGAGPAAGLRIGDAVLYWDEKNQALALAKYNASTPSSPTVANFYATGGVSALGIGPDVGSIDAMTFGKLTATSQLSTPKIIGTGTESSVLLLGNLNIKTNDGVESVLRYDEEVGITLSSNYLILGDWYLFVDDDNKLKYTNGSVVRTLTFTV